MAYNFRRRSCMLAALAAISAPVAANPVPDSRNASVARATARIEHPILLQNGRASQRGEARQQAARERPCAREDVPDGKPCRLIVTDLE